MGYLLHIETATPHCSVALSRDGKQVGESVATQPMSHISALMPLIDDLLKSAQVTASQLDAVSVSSGPGSYTGLRIGLSTAKGICYALNIPLIAVSSLQSAAAGVLAGCQVQNDDVIIPLIDARRMEVYAAVYNSSLQMLHPEQPWIVNENSLNEWSTHRIFLAGTGAEKLKPLFHEKPNVVFVDYNVHQAAFVIPVAYNKFIHAGFVDTAYFEPAYGKEFIPGKPVVKGLR